MAVSKSRVIAQRILSGQFLSWDVPLSGATWTRELSGPGGLNGVIDPELRHVMGLDGRPLIEEWSTALFYEVDGLIRGGGIVQSVSAERGTLTVSAPGFSSYPNGVPIITNYTPVTPNAQGFEDPTATFKNLWAHLQAFPDGNIGVTVEAPATYMVLSGGTAPYTALAVDGKDYDGELKNIATSASFDFTEVYSWNGNNTAINKVLKVGFPRLGRKREDLRFAQGENIVALSPVGADGSKFSNEVIVYGLSEGPLGPKGVSAVRDGRVRRPVVVNKKFYSQALSNKAADEERRSRELKLDITEVQIAEHPNAPIAAINVGDDILVQANVPWYGSVQMYVRVLAIEQGVDTPGRATLKTQRSDSFIYASDTNPGTSALVVSVGGA